MMKNLFVVLLMMTGLQAAAQKVEDSVEELTRLMVTPDEAGLDALAHPSLTYGHSSGKIENKAEFMDQLLSGRSDFRKIDLSEQTVDRVGNTAVVRHILEADTFDGGKPGTVKLKIVLVWVKEKKDWKLLARQAVRLP